MKKINNRKKILKEAGILLIIALLVLSTSAVMADTYETEEFLLSFVCVDEEINSGQPCSLDEDIIRFDDGTNFNAIGLTNGGTYQAAIRITPAEFAPYDGYKIYSVLFYHHETGEHSGSIRIYSHGTSSSPGPLITSEPYTVSGTDWFTITLSEPVEIDINNDTWVAVQVTHAAAEFPIGVDPGPAVPEKGDWVFAGGWEELRNIEDGQGGFLDYNWNIGAVVDDEEPTYPELEIDSITGGKGITVDIKNVGDGSATDVEWSIKIEGGFYIKERDSSGSFETLAANGSKEITMGVRGIGLGILFDLPKITVNVKASNADKVNKSVDAKIFLTSVTIQ